MTVLVDEARWAWRGQRWAHLVSDNSYDELHEFARTLGKRRLGFQGDHYDIAAPDRDRAVDLGAETVDSRELVRRLRSAGLRNRRSKPGWQRVAQWPAGTPVGLLDSGFVVVLDRLDLDLTAADAGLYQDPAQRVLLLDLAPGVGVAAPDSQAWIGEPRADGGQSVEIFLSR